MKNTERSFDSLGFKRKLSKTPSTTYSYSESPMLGNSQSCILSRNLVSMQTQLAQKLKKQAQYLSIQVPILQHKSELASLRLEKLQRNSEVVKKTLKKLSKFSTPEIRLSKIQNIEAKNQQTFKETTNLKAEVKTISRRVKHSQMLDKKEVFLREQLLYYENEHRKMVQKKKELCENLDEIKKCQKKVLEIFLGSQEKLEALMISKEELLLSIPLLKEPKEGFGNKKNEIEDIRMENLELKKVLRALNEEFEVMKEENEKNRREFNKAVESFQSRSALVKVQTRYLEEKRVRVELAKKELRDIEKAASKVTSRSHSNDGSVKGLKTKTMTKPMAQKKKAVNKSSYS